MDMREMNRGVIAEFRRCDGKLSGPLEGASVLLLTTIGRRSGKPHTTPVGFVDVGERMAVAAANGGSDEQPDWFLNIGDCKEITVEIPGGSIASLAEITAGSEREQLLNVLVESLPGMSEHVASTNREIPVVVIRKR